MIREKKAVGRRENNFRCVLNEKLWEKEKKKDRDLFEMTYWALSFEGIKRLICSNEIILKIQSNKAEWFLVWFELKSNIFLIKFFILRQKVKLFFKILTDIASNLRNVFSRKKGGSKGGQGYWIII